MTSVIYFVIVVDDPPKIAGRYTALRNTFELWSPDKNP